MSKKIAAVLTKGTKSAFGAWTTEELNAYRAKGIAVSTQAGSNLVEGALKAGPPTHRADMDAHELANSNMLGPQGDDTSELYGALQAHPKDSHIAAAVRGDHGLTGAARELNAELGLPDVDAEGRPVMPLPPAWFNSRAVVQNGEAIVASYTSGAGPDVVTAVATDSGGFQPDPATVDIMGTVYALPWMSMMATTMVQVPYGIRRLGYVTQAPTADDRVEGDVTTASEILVSDNPLVPERLDAVVNVTSELMALNPAAVNVAASEIIMSIMHQLELKVLGVVATAVDPPASDPTAAGTFQALASLATTAVDGKYAGSESMVAMLVSPRFNTYCSSLYQSAGDASALMRLKQSLGTYVVSAHMENTYGALNVDGFTKNDGTDRFADVLTIGARGRDAVVCATWPGIGLAVDPYSQHGASRVLFGQSLYAVHCEAGTGSPRNGAVLRTRVGTVVS